jgi:hypothetical protein
MHRFASSAVVLAFLAGATVGLASQPAAETFELRFRGRPMRSELGGFSTRDQQFFLLFSEGAVRPSPGQTRVHITITPLDPATLGPRPEGLQAVGNAYRLQATYGPSSRPIARFAAEVKVGFSYSLAASTTLADLTLMYSRDGRAWTRLQTAEAPDAREVSSQIPGTGYLLLATSPATAVTGDSSGAGRRRLALALVAAMILVAGLLVLRRRRRATASRGAA